MSDTKKCPYCAEAIKAEAVICRFCNIDLHTGKQYGADENGKASSVKAQSSVTDGVRIGFGMFIVLPLLVILMLVTAFVFLGGTAGVLSLFGHSTPAREKRLTDSYLPPPPPPRPEKSTEELTEERIQNATRADGWSARFVVRMYADNKVQADLELKNKIMGVTGRIQKVGKDYDGRLYVVLVGHGDVEEYPSDIQYLEGVWCYFSSSHVSEIAALQVGNGLTVRGICVGKKYNIALTSCIIPKS